MRYSVSAKLEDINADTVTDVQGDGYYLIRGRNAQDHPGAKEHPLKIIPEMTAVLDILIDAKTGWTAC
jgi:adhesin transport system membrane fusion protein